MAAVTISVHHGSKVARGHNLRKDIIASKEWHIDPNGIHETWLDEDPRDAYKRIFGDALRDYNAAQLAQHRPKRCIRDYYNTVKADAKRHPVYEVIVGVYGRDSDTGLQICDDATGKAIMRTYLDGWQQRNPNLHLIGAYYHADEVGEPHLHIDFVPVAHGYKRGLSVQCSESRALREMGFDKTPEHATGQIAWEARENAVFDNICQSYGLTVAHPRAEGRQHIDTDLYRQIAARDAAITDTQQLLSINDDLDRQIRDATALRDHANKQAQKAVQRAEKLALRTIRQHKGAQIETTYDRGIVDKIRNAAIEAQEALGAMQHTDLDISAQYEAATRIREAAEATRAEADALRRDQQRLIDEAAQQQYMDWRRYYQDWDGGVASQELKRLRDLCRQIKLKDGSSVLDLHIKQEQQLMLEELDKPKRRVDHDRGGISR